jgi:hypothetical protein
VGFVIGASVLSSTGMYGRSSVHVSSTSVSGLVATFRNCSVYSSRAVTFVGNGARRVCLPS